MDSPRTKGPPEDKSRGIWRGRGGYDRGSGDVLRAGPSPPEREAAADRRLGMAAAQGLALREHEPAPGTGAALTAIRRVSPRLGADRSLSDEIEAVRNQIGSGALIEAAGAACGGLD